MVDNGQHVFLRCCTAYRGLLARLGMTGAVSLQDRFDVTVLAPGGRARLRRTALPGPLHMGQALMGYGFLSRAQRLRVARAALAMAALNPAKPELDRQRLGDWLAAHGQDERTRRLLWDLFTVSALNVDGDDANLSLAATVVKTALLGARDAADIGVPSVPLGVLHGQAAGALLARLGAQVRLSAKVAAIEALPGGPGPRFRVRLAGRRGGNGAPAGGAAPDGTPLDGTPVDGAAPDGAARHGAGLDGAALGGAGEVIEADGVVLAVPPAVAARLAPAGTVSPGTVSPGTVGPGTAWEPTAASDGHGPAGQPGPEQWRELATSPIVNVHVIYDRRVTRLPFAAAVDSPVQWVFDRTGPSGLRSGQYLAVSLSAADGYVDVPASALRERFLPAMADLFPAARDARVTDFFVTRERRATLRQVPGCERLRPGAATARAGPGAGRCLDRHRMARHDGGSRAKRFECGAGAAPGARGAGRWVAAAGPGPGRAVGPGERVGSGDRAGPGGRGSHGMTAVIPAGVETARDLVGPALAAAVERLSPDVRKVAAYHLGLAGPEGALPGAADGVRPGGGARGGRGARGRPPGAGKALRPALTLLSARAANAAPERGVPAAVAVELVHNFSLLHDDIMDGDTERRHRPTAWTVYGTGAAILAGDAMLALAQDILLEDAAPQGVWAARALSAAVQRLIAGQGADLAFEQRDDVSLTECLTMAGDKTAALMACACSIGSIHVGAPPQLAMGLAAFGAHAGLAFQLTDDLLGIWGAPEVTGKPVRSDLRARKKSLPVVAALSAGTAEAGELAALLAREEPLSEDDLALAAGLVEAAGGKTWTENEAATQLAAAHKCLADTDMPGDVRAEFAGIAEFITARQW